MASLTGDLYILHAGTKVHQHYTDEYTMLSTEIIHSNQVDRKHYQHVTHTCTLNNLIVPRTGTTYT